MKRGPHWRISPTLRSSTASGVCSSRLSTSSRFTHDFSMSADYYRQLEGWMAERGLIDATPGADVYWTNDLAL